MSESASKTRGGFDRFLLHEALNRGIQSAGFETPRPIQVEAIPTAMGGGDVLGLAQTGTGKTAAFALPVLNRLLNSPRQKNPRALVIAPTRELATQIAEETRMLARYTQLSGTTLFGGVPISRNLTALRRQPDIVIGCPGRILDLIDQGALYLGRVETLVLDEADHMFDMGFLPDIRKILAKLPDRRQNLLFSATMPREIRHLADEILHEPKVVELSHSAPAETIDHALLLVDERRKRDLLDHVLGGEDCDSAIVFTRTKHRAKRLALQLTKAGHSAVGIQGNLSQPQRDRAMRGFRSRKYDVLVATDIVARGIDVTGVSHVINYDVPNTPEAYTHRIGRTGRAEREGVARTFVTEKDRSWVRATERMIGTPIPRQSVSGFDGGFEIAETPARDPRPKRGDARGSHPGGPPPASKGGGSGRGRRRRRRG